MSGPSKIEWTNATWNPVTGCTKVSPGCKNCYAERLWPKVEGARVKREGGEPRPFTQVICHPERLDWPLHRRTPRRIFVNSMSDLFHEDVPDDFIDGVMTTIKRCEVRQAGHIFQVLTKRPARMLEFMRPLPTPPSNLWLGVSVEDQATADNRIPLLLQTQAAVRWISAEPLLGPVDLRHLGIARGRWLDALTCDYIDASNGDVIAGPPSGVGPLDWVVAGGESGPEARPPHPNWFRSLRGQCAITGVPFFFKQWGAWAPLPLIESLHYRGTAIDKDGKVPPLSALDKLREGDTSILVGRTQMSYCGKKRAGRLLDGRTHDEYPA